MSVHVSSLVWQRSATDGTELLVMLALAEFANDDGAGIWPAMPKLARKARLSERQAQRVIRRLAEMGEIEITAGGGRGKSNHYRVCVEALAAHPLIYDPRARLTPKGDIQGQETVTSRVRNGDIQGRETVTCMSPDPSVEPSREPSLDPSKLAGGTHAKAERTADRRLQAWWADAFGDGARPLTRTQLRELSALEVRAAERGVGHYTETAIRYTARKGPASPALYLLNVLKGWIEGKGAPPDEERPREAARYLPEGDRERMEARAAAWLARSAEEGAG